MQSLPSRAARRFPIFVRFVFGIALLAGIRPVIARQAQPTTAPSQGTAVIETTPTITPPCEDERNAIRPEASAPIRAIRLLNLARCRLVTQCTPGLTAELYDQTDLRKELNDLLAEIDKTIQDAESIIEHDAKGQEDADTEPLQQRIELLRTFRAMFAALTAFDETPEARERLIDACGDMSLFVDDSRKAVAESARCWQGLGYLRAGKPERALQVLRPMLTTPSAGRLGFHARLLRCRALAAQDRLVAAIALAQRLSSRVDSWFAEEEPKSRAAAADAVRVLHAELLQQLAASHRNAGRSALTVECETESRKLLRDLSLPLPADRRLCLTETIAGCPPLEEPEAGDESESP